MSATTLELHFLTPHGPKREGVNVPGVEVPGLLGEIGALPDHEAFITAITPGVVRFRDEDGDARIAVGAGFLEITEDGRAIILVERAVDAAEVDADAVREKLRAANDAVAKHAGSIDTAEYRTLAEERAWLEAQLRAAGA